MDQRERDGAKASDFQRFDQEKKRYAALKREAKMIKERAERPGGDVVDHPWTRASQRAKSDASEHPADRDNPMSSRVERRRKVMVWVSGGALLMSLLLAGYGALRLTRPANEGPLVASPYEIVVWHELEEGEALLLEEAAAAYSTGEIVVRAMHQPNLVQAVRGSAFLPGGPSLVITDLPTARAMAVMGLAAPVELAGDRALPERHVLPLAPDLPWSRPLAIFIVRSHAGTEYAEVESAFAHYLAQRINEAP